MPIGYRRGPVLHRRRRMRRPDPGAGFAQIAHKDRAQRPLATAAAHVPHVFFKDTMKYHFKDLVDIPKLQELTDDLYAAASIPSSIITMDGEILTGSGWQEICTEFHRKHPEVEKACIASDTKLRQHE